MRILLVVLFSLASLNLFAEEVYFDLFFQPEMSFSHKAHDSGSTYFGDKDKFQFRSKNILLGSSGIINEQWEYKFQYRVYHSTLPSGFVSFGLLRWKPNPVETYEFGRIFPLLGGIEVYNYRTGYVYTYSGANFKLLAKLGNELYQDGITYFRKLENDNQLVVSVFNTSGSANTTPHKAPAINMILRKKKGYFRWASSLVLVPQEEQVKISDSSTTKNSDTAWGVTSGFRLVSPKYILDFDLIHYNLGQTDPAKTKDDIAQSVTIRYKHKVGQMKYLGSKITYSAFEEDGAKSGNRYSSSLFYEKDLRKDFTIYQNLVYINEGFEATGTETTNSYEANFGIRMKLNTRKKK